MMNIVKTPDDPQWRLDVANADVAEAKVKVWSQLANLAGLAYAVALLASFLIVGGLVWEATPWG